MLALFERNGNTRQDGDEGFVTVGDSDVERARKGEGEGAERHGAEDFPYDIKGPGAPTFSSD